MLVHVQPEVKQFCFQTPVAVSQWKGACLETRYTRIGGRRLSRIQGIFHGRFDAQLAAETMSVDAVRRLNYQQSLISSTQHVSLYNLHP